MSNKEEIQQEIVGSCAFGSEPSGHGSDQQDGKKWIGHLEATQKNRILQGPSSRRSHLVF